MKHISCKECSEFLDEYLAGEVEPELLARFEEHLEKCPPCKVELESYRETIELARRCSMSCPDAPPPPVPENLVKAILGAKRDTAG